ncbi:MAG: acyltransferase [Chloroflexi bacterium]|nr:acyltransferase [Chloroflexota bacterium]
MMFRKRLCYHRAMTVSSPVVPIQYVPGLHALRVYAALSVVVGHVHEFIPGWFQTEVNTGILPHLLLTGTDSVTLFYVLSGFLLTSILLSEKRQRDQIDVMGFYLQRIRRVVPLYYVVLAVTAVVSIATVPDYAIVFGRQFDAVQFPAAILFAAFIPLALESISGMVSHYWSLGVEMVFYALVPWLTVARRVPLALGLVIALRLLILALTPVESAAHQIVLYLKVDSLAVGALFAWLWLHRRTLVERTLTTRPARIGLVLASAVLVVVELPSHNVLIDYVVTFVSGWLILNISAGSFVLENRLIRWLGDHTYGIYLWHMLALFLVGASGLAGVRVYAAVLGITMLLSILTRQLVERPFLRRRRPRPVPAPDSTLPGGIEGA